MSALVFMDTETTGLALDDDIWEFAAIRREPDGTESEHHLFITHDPAKCEKLPDSFRADHIARFPEHDCEGSLMGGSLDPDVAAGYICGLFHDRPHVVGAVPNFDTERVAMLLRRFDFEPNWHYHLIDVETLAVGFLAGRASHGDLDAGLALPDLPWNSDALAKSIGVTPAGEGERHTAMGDVLWTKRTYDAVINGV